MESNREDPAGFETEEEFPDEFQCCVCLDLLYKPVVLACGHISCFWCVFRAMNFWKESHCPVCRHPYNHFPSICQLLHFLLLKLYPVAYKRREQHVIEEEKQSKKFSPQLDYSLPGSEPSRGVDIYSGVTHHSITSSFDRVSVGSCQGEPSVTTGSSESTIVPHKDFTTSAPTRSTFEVSEQNCVLGDKLDKGQNMVLIADLLCAVCKELLYRPVVLNCGHVYCEACITSSSDKEIPRCQVCQSVHPNGYPKVCLVLEHFLEEHFSEQYALRTEAVSKQADGQNLSPQTCSTEGRKNTDQLFSKLTNDYLSWFSGQGPKVHAGVGCDYCGMCPIIGERYKCKDCKEKIGFDLCEGCYNSSSKLPGRFNQRHTPDHKFEIVQPTIRTNLVLRLGPEESEDDESDVVEDMEDVPPAPLLSANSPDDLENGSLEDQEDNHNTI